MKKFRKRLAACALALAALCCLSAPQRAYGEGEPQTIEIKTVDDLIALSENSVLDTYTVGKVFELTADIDLSGAMFEPIASFGGTFHGNGHVISGFYWNEEGSNIGLFRFVEQGALIEDLKVRVSLKPDGSAARVGGIAGTNRGRISGCSVSGRVEGRENTGAVAGCNEASGLIENCMSTAKVSGFKATGGIVGLNEGIVESCTNRGEVNTSDRTERSAETLTEASPLDGKILDAEKVYHTGGIAGKSTGTIRTSSNEGVVGYLHAGYNTGGIVGLQSGYITGCANRATVLGRKDTGGIAGQFEPYVMLRYEEDTIQKVQNQTDALLDQLGQLSDTLRDAGDETITDMDAVRSGVKDIRSGLQSNKKNYYDNTKNFTSDLDRELDRLENNMDEFELKVYDHYTEGDVNSLKADRARLNQLREQLKESLKTDPEQAKGILEEMSQLLQKIDDTTMGLPKSVENDVDDTTGNINDYADNLGVNIQGIRKLINDNKDKLYTDLEATDHDMTGRMDTVSSGLDRLFEALKDTSHETKDQMEAIRKQVRLISDTMDGSVDELKSRDDELINDVSDEQAKEPGSGLISGCENLGFIRSDSNTGGIVGIIGVELEIDPENDVEVDGEESLKIDRTARASVRGCTNREQVVSTNHYAGGIAGRADAGALTDNCNLADVEAEEGNYVGGIAGSSMGAVRENAVFCRISGKDYVGGVVGKGETVTGNRVIVSLATEERGEYRGAVAGDADGEISGNLFVPHNLAAVDGVTYLSQAEPLTYEEMISREGTPQEFEQLEVIYLVDGKEAARVPVSYGQPVPEEKIPKIPEKEGFYGFWEEKGQDCVRTGLKVNAEYRLWVTTISGSLRRGELPVLLAEGEFYPDTLLHVTEVDGQETARLPGAGRKATAYRYAFEAPEGTDFTRQKGKEIVFRILKPDEKRGSWEVTAVGADGRAVSLPVREDGSYLLCSLVPAYGGQSAEWTLLIQKKAANGYLLILAAVIAAGVLGAVFAVKTKRKSGNS